MKEQDARHARYRRRPRQHGLFQHGGVDSHVLVREMGWTSAEVGAYMSPVYLFTGIVITPLSGIISDSSAGGAAKPVRARRPCSSCWRPVRLRVYAEELPLIALGVMLPHPGYRHPYRYAGAYPARYKASAYGTYVTFLRARLLYLCWWVPCPMRSA